jgi:hypothetical protein
MMIAVSRMAAASTMTTCITKGGSDEEDAVRCLVAAAVAASPCIMVVWAVAWAVAWAMAVAVEDDNCCRNGGGHQH